MARSKDVVMNEFCKIRRRMNNRLAKAEREGRLEEEFARIEEDGLTRWRGIEEAESKPKRRRAAK